jgi:phosphoribosylanthranilate isomerase
MSRIKLKICGVQNTQEAEILVDVAVDYIGLNFVPGSKRCIAVDSARAILSIVKDCDIVPVLLFQSQPASQIIELADELDVHLLQLHGNEIEADYSLLRDKNQIIKAIYQARALNNKSKILKVTITC